MRFALTIAFMLLTATSALAQAPKFELKGSLSWALSEGVSFTGDTVPGSDPPLFVNRIDLADGPAYGLGGSMYLNRQLELGFLWDYQQSELVAKGSRSVKISDIGVDNYHGVLIYNFGSHIDRIRPMLFGGLGATVFRSVEFTDLDGNPRSSGSNSRFSSTWGAGVKIYATRHFGIQLDFKWTPTWVKSEPNGYWCYYYCYQSVSNDYANQWKFGGTLLARF